MKLSHKILRTIFSLSLMMSLSSIAPQSSHASATNRRLIDNTKRTKKYALYLFAGAFICCALLLGISRCRSKSNEPSGSREEPLSPSDKDPAINNKANSNLGRKQGGGDGNKVPDLPPTYNEDKRIVRVNKKKVSAVVPVIFRQTLESLERLSDDDINELKNEVQREIDEDKEAFLENYSQRQWQIDINKSGYIGLAMMKFKDDPKNDDYFYACCLVKIKKYNNSDGVNKDNVKRLIQNEMTQNLQISLDNHVVAEQM